MNTLSKKSPNDALNKFKLGLVNSVLKKANLLLGAERRPFADFESFDEAVIPSTSDVLVVVSQYLSAFEKLRAENIDDDHEGWFWRVPEGGRRIPTGPPKKLDQ
jgi:hypothetical protein